MQRLRKLPASQRLAWASVWDQALLHSISVRGLPATDEDWQALVSDESVGFGAVIFARRHHVATTAQPLHERLVFGRRSTTDAAAAQGQRGTREQPQSSAGGTEPLAVAAPGQQHAEGADATAAAGSSPGSASQQGAAVQTSMTVEPAAKRLRAHPQQLMQDAAAIKQHKSAHADENGSCQLDAEHGAGFDAVQAESHRGHHAAVHAQSGAAIDLAARGAAPASDAQSAPAAPDAHQPHATAEVPTVQQSQPLATEVTEALLVMARARWALLRPHLAADLAERPQDSVRLSGVFHTRSLPTCAARRLFRAGPPMQHKPTIRHA